MGVIHSRVLMGVVHSRVVMGVVHSRAVMGVVHSRVVMGVVHSQVITGVIHGLEVSVFPCISGRLLSILDHSKFHNFPQTRVIDSRLHSTLFHVTSFTVNTPYLDLGRNFVIRITKNISLL